MLNPYDRTDGWLEFAMYVIAMIMLGLVLGWLVFG